MKENKQRRRKRPQPYKKTQTGATHKSSGCRKIVRKWLKQAGLWYNKGYPGYEQRKQRGHKRGYKR